MRADSRLQKADEFRRHEGVVVRNVEADDPLALELALEAGGQLCTVPFFHHEHDVRPFDQFRRARFFGVRAQTRGGDLQTSAAAEDLLGRRAPQTVPAAEEQDVAHGARYHGQGSHPIVSVSLGLPAIFLWGGQIRAERPRRVILAHGDVVVWGGPARLTFHGADTLKESQHPLTGGVRFNLTFRKAW